MKQSGIAFRNDILSEIMAGLRILHISDQDSAKELPVKNIDAHGGQIALRMLRLLLKFLNFALSVCDYDSKPGGVLLRNRHDGNCHIRVMRFMIVEHHLIIHLVDVVAG